MTPAPGRDALDRLSAYLDGELGSAEAAALERELADDATLRAALESMRRLSGHLAVDDRDRQVARSIHAALDGRLVRPGGTARTLPRSMARPRVWLPLAASAVALAAVLVLALPGRPGASGRTVHEGAVAEQYSLALDALAQGQP